MENNINKLRLPNGLLVLFNEIHTAPIISSWMWYRVGSKDEITTRTGASHWVEHMQFKGTQKYPAGVLDKAISREGGYWNAFTYLDWTTYFETMPADKIDLALSLEADRMVDSRFDPEEVNSERTVIISERQGNENEPMFRLREEVQAAAFRVHPYHHVVIGDTSDLLTMQRQDLYEHYRRFYTPRNAVLSIAGDFDTEKMIARVRELYEPIPEGPEPPRIQRQEPEQNGERQVLVNGPGETTFVLASYRSPRAGDPDFFPYTLLDSLLTGPSGLNMFGGGISNKTSRLYQALVERELAVSVFGGLQANIDPYLYPITIMVHPRSSYMQAVKVLDDEITRLQQELPTEEELARAMKQARALFAYGSESISNQGFWMGFAEMFADYDWYLGYLDNLEKVRPEDVQRVAQTYLVPSKRVLGIYLPEGTPSEQSQMVDVKAEVEA